MTKVFHLASPRAGIRNRVGVAFTVHASAHQTPTTDTAHRDPVARQAAIENALSMALYFIRQPGNTAANLWAATARANRALTLLKQASQGNGAASPANAPCNSYGRA
jgi:hypothetical protein